MGYYIYKYVCDGEVKYIGKTVDMWRRFSNHKKETKFQNLNFTAQDVYYVECASKTQMDVLELLLINKYMPELNVVAKPKDNAVFTSVCEMKDFEWLPLVDLEKPKTSKLKENKPLFEEIFTTSDKGIMIKWFTYDNYKKLCAGELFDCKLANMDMKAFSHSLLSLKVYKKCKGYWWFELSCAEEGEEYKRRNSIPATQDCFAKSDYEHGIAGFWYFDWFINVLYKCVAMIFPINEDEFGMFGMGKREGEYDCEKRAGQFVYNPVIIKWLRKWAKYDCDMQKIDVFVNGLLSELDNVKKYARGGHVVIYKVIKQEEE